jgi:hypothetical protein
MKYRLMKYLGLLDYILTIFAYGEETLELYYDIEVQEKSYALRGSERGYQGRYGPSIGYLFDLLRCEFPAAVDGATDVSECSLGRSINLNGTLPNIAQFDSGDRH